MTKPLYLVSLVSLNCAEIGHTQLVSFYNLSKYIIRIGVFHSDFIKVVLNNDYFKFLSSLYKESFFPSINIPFQEIPQTL